MKNQQIKIVEMQWGWFEVTQSGLIYIPFSILDEFIEGDETQEAE